MKASIISKIVLVLCLLCLISGFITIDRHHSYDDNSKKKNNILTSGYKVAVIDLDGAIAASSENSMFIQESNASNMLKSLRNVKDDDEIEGIILKINSPGGTVGMSQNIYNQIMKIRTTKPVISVFGDVAASGGYYIACASDRIIAQEGTLTGSIGVIFSFMDYHNLLTEKLNINPVVIKSGKYKDIGSGTRQMTNEEKELMQNIIDDSYQQFLSAIREGRIKRTDNYSALKTELTEDRLRQNADGRIFTGKQAKELGFVDETGDLDTAKNMMEMILQEKYNGKLKVKLVNYNKRSSFEEYLFGFAESRYNSGLKLTDILPLSVIYNRKPLYLWE